MPSKPNSKRCNVRSHVGITSCCPPYVVADQSVPQDGLLTSYYDLQNTLPGAKAGIPKFIELCIRKQRLRREGALAASSPPFQINTLEQRFMEIVNAFRCSDTKDQQDSAALENQTLCQT